VKADKTVSNWLLLLCFMVFGMVAGGGHARTIGASFIMQDWAPVTGFIPPLNAAGWQRVYGLFQKTAQYQAHPIGMAQFRALFWPMFLDRCWGRLMALVLLVPLAWFWRRGRVSNRLALWILALFGAGGAQAVFGWYMVQAGLRPGVLSPPPLLAAPHFFMAMLIFSALLWTALSVRAPRPAAVAGAYLKPWLNASIGLILATMLFGALVAATNAITVFNSFPLMDGSLVPPGLWALHPAWMNVIANQATVQFCHRMLATATALVVVITAVLGLRDDVLSQGQRDWFLVVAGLVALQYLLGMATIVLGAAELGYVHELNAVLLLAAAIAARHGLRGARSGRRLPASIAAEGANL
jgi:cytochrome c oxidase assembly protein subunit 15